MKKSVSDLLNNCQPQELDSFLDAVTVKMPEEADGDRIRALAMQKAGVSPKHRTLRKVALIAACITVVAAILVGCYVAEKVEYDNAVKFFDLNNFDTEGMSRDDIKRVYRDITTERFQYSESYELLKSSQEVTAVEGVAINITNNANNMKNGAIESLSVGQFGSVGHGDIPDDTLYFVDDEFQKSGKNVWRTKLPHYYSDYYIAGGKALIWGSYIYDEANDYMHTSVALIDDKDGKLLWEKTLDSKYHFDEDPQAVLTDDGRIAVLTVATDDRFSGENYLVFRELDLNGKIVKEHEQRKDDINYINLLTPLSDGWLAEYDTVMLGGGSWEVSYLIKFNKDGAIQHQWRFFQDDVDSFEYKIADMIEHDGKLFVCAQARPNYSTLYENADYENIPENTDSLADGFTDKWRDAARKEFSAVLLVFETKDNKPERFYTVEGAMALSDSLRVDDDGNLVWQVGRIVKCGYAPWANSYSLYGITRRYDYTLDSNKKLIKQDRTSIFKRFQTH